MRADMAEIVKRDVLNIKEASARAKEYGMNISEYTLRRIIRSTCADGCDNAITQ